MLNTTQCTVHLMLKTKLASIIGITTNGASSMVGAKIRVVALLTIKMLMNTV